jgi:hypothetical protein
VDKIHESHQNPLGSVPHHLHFALQQKCLKINLKFFNNKTTLWRAAHLCGQLPVLFINETSSNIVDTFVPCDPNMYSHLCTEIYLSLFTALD